MPKFSLASITLFITFSSFCSTSQDKPYFVGGLEEDRAEAQASPVRVRNDVAQPSEPIVTKRYFKIKKGSFPEVLKVSQEGVWPFFEKIGSRVIGMWQVVHPEESGSTPSADYDEVILMTQYASVEHWKASRKMAQMGGNGPDWEKARKAIAFRRSLTIETSLQFLKGSTWHNPPYYMPALMDESRIKPSGLRQILEESTDDEVRGEVTFLEE